MDIVTYALLSGKVSSVESMVTSLAEGFAYKGSKSSVSALPDDADAGDLYTVDGKKYVWDGTAWVELKDSVELDATLSTQGKAADAKAVGDALVPDTTLAVSGKAADAKKTGDEVSALKTAFTEEDITTVITAATFTAMDGYVIGSNGQVSQNASYITFYKDFDFDCSIWFVDPDDLYRWNSLLAISTVKDNVYTARKRYIINSENSLPTANSPDTISQGTRLYICCQKAQYTANGYPQFHANYESGNKILASTVKLGETQINQVSSELGVSCYAKYEIPTAPESSETERLNVYIPTPNGFVNYRFGHFINQSVNANIWRMGLAFAVDKSLNNPKNLVTSGEWEIAIKLKSRNDFSGGIMHGNEVFTSLSAFVDGVKTELSSITNLTTFTELKIVQVSTLYDNADGSTPIITHGSEHVFTADGLKINQSSTWLVSATATTCYMAMFPIIKSIGKKVFTDINYSQREINGKFTEIGVRKTTLISNDNDIISVFAISKYPEEYINNYGDYLLITDNGEASYNKCYYCITSSTGSVDYEIASGTIWRSEAEYKITA